MERYIWFHPTYVEEGERGLIPGQKKNAKAHGYIVLNENELDKVQPSDHLTIIGHTIGPKKENEDSEREDTGSYIQAEPAEEVVRRLKQSGLSTAPKLLSLEACQAGKVSGIAEQLSKQTFFKYSIIEANLGPVGRNFGSRWSHIPDAYGRVVLAAHKNFWLFYLQGYLIQSQKHGEYELAKLITELCPVDFQQRFLAHYQPGFFGGRVGRYCSKGNLLSIEKALFFAQENQSSATATALDLTIKSIYSP